MSRRMLDDSEINQIAQEIAASITPPTPEAGELQKFLNAKGDLNYLFWQSEITELTSDILPFSYTKGLTQAKNMFYYCTRLTSVSLFDTSDVTNMNNMFEHCESLMSVPSFNTSKVTDMKSMFGGCEKIKTLPMLDTSNCTSFYNMLSGCFQLTEIPAWDVGKGGGSLNSLVGTCPRVTHIHLKNINDNFNCSSCKLMEREAILEVIGNLKTFTTGTHTLTLGSTLLAKLTEEDKKIATDKGWTLA